VFTGEKAHRRLESITTMMPAKLKLFSPLCPLLSPAGKVKESKDTFPRL
jgi:hypothetical protein